MDTQIKLGDFVFEDLEIPQQINFGGNQQLVQHDLIGGVRVIDALGQSDSDISWSGLMYGPTSLQRAHELNQLRVGGQQLNLQWFDLNYNVIIQNFTANTEKYFQVTYTITLRVITDGANPINANPQSLLGFNDAINNDLTTSNNIAAQVNVPAVTASMATLTTAVQNVPTFNGASPATIQSVSTPLTSALKSVTSAITSFAETLFGTTS